MTDLSIIRDPAYATSNSTRVPDVGAVAPDFVFARPVRRARQLADLRGTPVVLLFHDAIWNPARGEIVAAYERALAAMPGGIEATLLDIDEGFGWDVLGFGDASLDVSVVHAIPDDAATAYGVRGRSAAFVIDAEGVVRWRRVADGDSPAAPDDVAEALASLDGEPRSCATCTRRDFVAAAVGAALIAMLAPRTALARPLGAMNGATPAAPRTLRVNGREIALPDDPRVTLLDALREYAGLTGTKKGCDHGQCGACTVHVDGRRVLSCLSLAAMQVGKEITTIEGLARPVVGSDGANPSDAPMLHPMQRAFVAHDGFQCGYCTSGQIMSAVAVLEEPWGAADDDVREAMSGNICRCGAYPGIVAAIQAVRRGEGTRTARPSR